MWALQRCIHPPSYQVRRLLQLLPLPHLLLLPPPQILASPPHPCPAAGSSMFGGTLAWAAPELLLAVPCTNKIDIYSLGVVRRGGCTAEGGQCFRAGTCCVAGSHSSSSPWPAASGVRAGCTALFAASRPPCMLRPAPAQVLWELATQEVPHRGFVSPPPPSDNYPEARQLPATG